MDDRDFMIQHLTTTTTATKHEKVFSRDNTKSSVNYRNIYEEKSNNNNNPGLRPPQQPTNRSATSLSETQFLNSVSATSSSLSSSSSLVPDRTQPVRVWRDPHLIASTEIRHVDSPQHHTAFMAHAGHGGGSGGNAGPPSSMPYHHHPSSTLLPLSSAISNPVGSHQQRAGHYVPSKLNEQHWRYPGAPGISASNFVSRPPEDHNARDFRTEQDGRDKRTDKKSTDLAVQQHFDESFRLAQQKRNWPSSIPSVKYEDEQQQQHQSRHMLLTTATSNPQLDKRYFGIPGSQATTYNNSMGSAQNNLIKTEPASSHLQNESIGIGKISVDPKLMYNNNNNNNNNNKIEVNQRSREQQTPPERQYFSSVNHHQNKPAGLIYAGGGTPLPLQRAKVSSPAPPQIYGKPGITASPISGNVGPGRSHYSDSHSDGLPLSLTSKTSTRVLEAPPLSSSLTTSSSNNSLPKHEVRSDDVAAYYMYSNNCGPNSYRQHGATTAASQNLDIQTQPLDLGGKKRKPQESFPPPQNLDPKKSKNDDSPLPLDLKPKDRAINFSNYNNNNNSSNSGIISDVKPSPFNTSYMSIAATTAESNNGLNNNGNLPILGSITSSSVQLPTTLSSLSSSNSITLPFSGLLSVPSSAVTVSALSSGHSVPHRLSPLTSTTNSVNNLVNSSFRNISVSQPCTSSPPPLQITNNNLNCLNKNSPSHQLLLLPSSTPAITIKPLVSIKDTRDSSPLPLDSSIISTMSSSTLPSTPTPNTNVASNPRPITPITTASTNITSANTTTTTTTATATTVSTINKGSTSQIHKLKKAWLQRHSGEDGSSGDYSPVKNNNNNSSSITTTNNNSKSPPSSVINMNSDEISTNIGCDKSDKSSTSTSSSNGQLNNNNSNNVNQARNSRGGGKKGAKSRRRKAQKDSNRNSPVGSLNGHNSSSSTTKKRTSSSSASDEHDDKRSTTPRQPLKKQRLIVKETTTPVETPMDNSSVTESENGGSDSNDGSSKSSQQSTPQGQRRKRGRKPTTSTSSTTTPATTTATTTTTTAKTARKKSNPFKRPPIHLLKKNGVSFLQDGSCSEVAQKLGKCRECRWSSGKGSKKQTNIFCRFYAFRKLRYTKNGVLAIAGFSDPNEDASKEDLNLWIPSKDNIPDLELNTSKLLISQLGDQFCDLIQQEKEALEIRVGEGEPKAIAWKRVVQGIREMCDVCDTTLFNYHWACHKCGFVVCIGCYKGRKNNSVKIWTEPGKDRDDFQWLFCSNRAAHELDKLMLTQAIAGDSLNQLGKSLHEIRHKWNIPQHCGCVDARNLQSTTCTPQYPVKMEANGVVSKQAGDSSDSEESDEEDHSTLRELLIRAGSDSNEENVGSNEKEAKSSLDSKVTSELSSNSTSSNNNNNTSCPLVVASNDIEAKNANPSSLVHFVRSSSVKNYSRQLHPIKVMTLSGSNELYPQVPHSWLCSGKLLRLEDPNNEGNYLMFQDMWMRGQPVMVTNVNNRLDKTLWTPESFSRDYGHKTNDLINCMTGKTVHGQPMKKFWDGFDHISKRLKDDKGNPMLLKLKDWPPGEDFADVLPERFKDLMAALPLTDYTNRNGRMNLAARLPDNFVKPDLGPKMYIAYGSGLHLDKGTTNLHLDMSDAVNVMVHVGVPKDCDNSEHLKAVKEAIEESDCDVLTIKKVLQKSESIGALWHIYHSRDADKIRDLLNKVAKERGIRLEPNHDPIHDQSWYLDTQLRKRLMDEYNVSGYPICQCLGDAVFIPAGAPHQVRNLNNCIKIAEDFVSPENVSHCFDLTEEFRRLSNTHSNHEDKLQIKNIIYFSVKDALSVLTHHSSMKNEGNAAKNSVEEKEEVNVSSISSV